MAIPDYQTLMLPLLRFLGDEQEHTAREARERIAHEFHLDDEALREMVPSGRKPLFADRLSWATTYMKQAGLLSTPRRGTYRITPRGLEVLRSRPLRIDNELLSRFPEFNEFRERSRHRTDRDDSTDTDVETPQERLDAAYLGLRESIEAELLQQVKSASPAFFEQLVVQLLVKMGYGGSLEDAGRAVGRSGDGGIDGIINEDRLGLDVVHIQAKRWDQKTIGRPDVQSFAGSLDGVRARKGIFITTSTFSHDARSYVERIDKRIALIDGVTLARLMFDFGVGVSTVAAYEIKRIDADFFAEE